MTLDVVGIGNAIVDILCKTDDDFLIRHGMTKGSMALISEEDAHAIYDDMGPAIEISGGSAANTIAGIAALGGNGGFIGKIANDQMGEVFAHDIRSVGVEFSTPHSTTGVATARSYILVTPDAQRTMNTFLGACQELSVDDVDEDQIRRASITYLEGYLWDPPAAKEAFLKAMDIAHDAGNRVALTLSDSFCVDRYHSEFLELVENQVDILFANEAEIKALFATDSFDKAALEAAKHLHFAVLTRSEKGAVIVTDGQMIPIPAHPTEVVDTTGAGDLYAGGFLYGLTQGKDALDCGRIAAMAAAEIISHVGARPEADLKKMMAETLG